MYCSQLHAPFECDQCAKGQQQNTIDSYPAYTQFLNLNFKVKLFSISIFNLISKF